MRGSFKISTVLACLAFAEVLLATTVFAIDRDSVIGTWEGESKCTVANSPCHDEHVVYEIVGDRRKKAVFKLDAYKLTDGQQRELMGSLDCLFSAASSSLTCTGHSDKVDTWDFKISEGHMDGTLVVGAEKQLYRKINVEKQEGK